MDEQKIERAELVQLSVIHVTIVLRSLRIDGEAHLPPGTKRFSDAWESMSGDDRDFLPLTNARIVAIESNNVVANAVPFVQVKKAQIQAVYPTPGVGSEGSPT